MRIHLRRHSRKCKEPKHLAGLQKILEDDQLLTYLTEDIADLRSNAAGVDRSAGAVNLRSILEWLWENRAAIIQLILTLIPLFIEDGEKEAATLMGPYES